MSLLLILSGCNRNHWNLLNFLFLEFVIERINTDENVSIDNYCNDHQYNASLIALNELKR